MSSISAERRAGTARAQAEEGRGLARYDALRRALGKDAYELWALFVRLRDEKGYEAITATTANLASRLKLTPRRIKRALAVLRQAGLLEDLGWMVRPAPKGNRITTVFLYARRVLGSWAGGPYVSIPAAAVEVLQAKPRRSWGGSRQGAGRPAGIAPRQWKAACRFRRVVSHAVWRFAATKKWTPSVMHPWLDILGIICQLGPCPGPRECFDIDHIRPLASFNLEDPAHLRAAFSPENHQWLPCRTNTRKADRWTPEADEIAPHIPDTRISQVARLEAPKLAPEQDRQVASREVPEQEIFPDVPVESFSSSLSLGRESPRAREKPHAGAVPLSSEKQQPSPSTSLGPLRLARYGGAGVAVLAGPGVGLLRVPAAPWNIRGLEAARVPMPPLLPSAGEVPDEQVAWLMVKAYRGAVASRTGKSCGIGGGRAAVKRSAIYAQLLACAQAMREEDVAPAGWAAWSIDVWQEYQGEARRPPIGWMFHVERVRKHAGWFRRDGGGAQGGLQIYSRSHRELLLLHERMRFAICRAETPAQELAAVEHFFPIGRYEELVALAKAENARTSAALRAMVRRGEFVWHLGGIR